MFRNKEIRRFAALYAGVSAVAAILGFCLQPAAGILALASAALYGGAFYAFTRARYQRIAKLSEQIDLVLHDADRLWIDRSDEGEFSVLQSELGKMTLRIREQNDALKSEKAHLADSLADIAHQLRTPLTSANLTLSLLRNEPDADRRGTLLRETERLFRQMDWLLTALLRLSRLDAGMVTFQSERVEAAELVRASLHPLLIPLELHNIRVDTETPEDVFLTGDFGWLTEALQNILKNCMESAGDGGWISVACGDNPLYTQIIIRDSGAGFCPEDLPHLFERFYRGKSAGAVGYGIGLALSRTIILGQGGTVLARNHPQGGALFVMRFPK